MKNSKWKTFLFFLFLASLFWLLTKISKEFSAPVTCKIEYQNIPETLSAREISDEEITFNLFTSGYDFFGYTLKQPSLIVDLSKYSTNINNKIVITGDELIKDINEQFSSSRTVNSLDIDALTIMVDPIVKKKVFVVIKKDVTYKKGFKQVGPSLISPDSIFISGPEKQVALIDSLVTENIKLDFVDQDISEKVNIQTPNFDDINLSNESVLVSWEVKEIAQKKFEIPITLINKPTGKTIKIIPNRIKIRVNVTLDHYNDIDEENFKITCDYNKRNVEENFMVAHLDETPKWVENVELETQKIDFLIFQK